MTLKDSIYKKIWEDFKEKYGEEYLGYEGGQDISEVMDEFEKKYMEEEKKYHEYTKTFKAGYGEKPTTSRPKPKPRPIKKI